MSVMKAFPTRDTRYVGEPGRKNIVMLEELFRLGIEELLIWFDELHPLHRPKFLQSIFNFSQLLLQLVPAVRDQVLIIARQ